jgi:hypothetical protein
MPDSSWPDTPADLHVGDTFIDRATQYYGEGTVRRIRADTGAGGFWITKSEQPGARFYGSDDQIRITRRAR